MFSVFVANNIINADVLLYCPGSFLKAFSLIPCTSTLHVAKTARLLNMSTTVMRSPKTSPITIITITFRNDLRRGLNAPQRFFFYGPVPHNNKGVAPRLSDSAALMFVERLWERKDIQRWPFFSMRQSYRSRVICQWWVDLSKILAQHNCFTSKGDTAAHEILQQQVDRLPASTLTPSHRWYISYIAYNISFLKREGVSIFSS